MARKPAAPKPKVERPAFEFGDVTSFESLMDELVRYSDFANTRKGMAEDVNKAQYWSGQMYANKALIAALRAQIDFGDTTGEDEAQVA